MTPTERHFARLRTRQWHEQRTAAERCHRCPNRVERYGLWFCRACRIAISQQRAFVRFVNWVKAGKCVACRKRATDGKKLRCWTCRHKGLNASGSSSGSLTVRGTERRLWDG